jgi:AraC-like DNA-binding protein
MNETLLNGYQALQLLALGPCLFMVFFLCVAGRKAGQVLVPVLYFLSLSCSFLLPLRDVLGLSERLHAILLLGTSMEAALSFLLIVQFMTGRMPGPLYWTILAAPLVGGSPFVYANIVTESDICIYEHLCTSPRTFRMLFNIFSMSLTCLLTVVVYRRLNRLGPNENLTQTRQKYALVLALVVLNLALLGIDFLRLIDYTDQDHGRLAKTIVRIGFIYLTLTLIFRLFDRPVELAYERIPLITPAGPSEKDLALAAQIRALFEQEKLHRDTGLSREKLARKLAVTEAVLSRVANQCFHDNVSMLINHYRVEEAKARLLGETTPITTIAFEVGFSSIPSFNRVFRQLSGMSPSALRNQKQAG